MTLKELFTDESRWTQGTPARDEKGNAVSPNDPLAVKFCLAGGIQRCYTYEEGSHVRRQLRQQLHWQSIIQWNDAPERTFEDIQRLVNELDI